MFLVDDILLSPFRGVLWVVKKIHDAAEEERRADADAITGQLSELYMMLETGAISEEAYEEQESELLDRLDALRDQAEASQTAGGDSSPGEAP